MLMFMLEGMLTIAGMILGGQAINLGVQWLKYGFKKLSPPKENKKEDDDK